MMTEPSATLSDRSAVLRPLAALLQKLDLSPVPVDAAQYRSVATRLTALLRELPMNPQIDALLGQFPAAAELYENIQYAQAGLCRSPLDVSISAEQRAREVIERQRRAAATSTPSATTMPTPGTR